MMAAFAILGIMILVRAIGARTAFFVLSIATTGTVIVGLAAYLIST